MADGDEDAVAGDLAAGAGRRMFRSRTPVTPRAIRLAQHLLDGVVPDHLDLGVGEQALLQDPLGAELVAAMHQGHLRRRSW